MLTSNPPIGRILKQFVQCNGCYKGALWMLCIQWMILPHNHRDPQNSHTRHLWFKHARSSFAPVHDFARCQPQTLPPLHGRTIACNLLFVVPFNKAICSTPDRRYTSTALQVRSFEGDGIGQGLPSLNSATHQCKCYGMPGFPILECFRTCK